MSDNSVTFWGLGFGYAMLLIPLAIILWYRLAMFGSVISSIIRMTVQLLLVGVYLQFVFKVNNPLLNTAWLIVMVVVADVSIIRGTDLKMRPLLLPLFAALAIGTAVPLAIFAGLILREPAFFDARFVIPVGGMILGNCLRADIIGIRTFYQSLRTSEKAYLLSLGQGASLVEATQPYIASALTAALSPTVATMATIGIVSLPGMMTGVILGGNDPVTAIKYQIAIMISIFTGTAITVVLAILLTRKTAFTPYGTVDKTIFSKQ